MSKRVLTGIQPTNNLHIGNYIGAIKQIQKLQLDKNNEIFLFVPNLHSLTGNFSHESITNLMKVFLASCSDEIKFYIQSEIPQIPYLSWIFSCCTPVGNLLRMTQFKSKENDDINSGYLFYPILMAADILIIDAEIVPVGIDQKQHIELARDIVSYYKNKYNHDIFVKPEPMIAESIKIKSLQDPNKKMSKSDPSTLSCIFLNDSPEEINKKISKAITDGGLMPTNIELIKEERPAVYNLCVIYKEISEKDFSYIEQTFGGGYMSKFKENLSRVLVEFTQNLQEKMNNISEQQIKNILTRDKKYILEIAQSKIDKIVSHIGLSI